MVDTDPPRPLPTTSLWSQPRSASLARQPIAGSRAASKALALVGARRRSKSPRTELASVVMYPGMAIPLDQNGGAASSATTAGIAESFFRNVFEGVAAFQAADEVAGPVLAWIPLGIGDHCLAPPRH